MNQREALEVLATVKARVGRNYKTLIRTAWETGNYSNDCLGEWSSQLQTIRNTFGPSWLVKPLTDGQVAVLKWLKEKPGTLMPHTTNPPYCRAWDDHKPATPASFHSLEKLGYIEKRNTHFWHLTRDGESIA